MKRPAFLARVGAVICALSLLIIPYDNYAFGDSARDDIQAKIDRLRKENEDRKNQIESLGGSISENEEKMRLIGEQIDGINEEITKMGQLIISKQDSIDAKKAEIEAVKQSISDKEYEIEQKKADIKIKEEENKRNLKRFSKLARALYMTDPSNSLPVLNGSDDWYNYYVYSDVVKNISNQSYDFMKSLMASIEAQQKMINDLNIEINKFEQDKKKLEEQRNALEDEVAVLESEKSALDEYAAEQKSYLYGLAAENESLKSKIDGLEYDIAASNKKMDELDKELQELIRKAQQDGTGSQGDYSSNFRWPLDPQFHLIVTYFGWDNNFGGRYHRGIDIEGANTSVSNANIYTAQSGTVIRVSNTCPHDFGKWYNCGCGGGWGNYIVVDHGGGVSTLYAHCRKIFVHEGQQVTKGDVIGLVGTTGWSTSEHLHLEVRENGNRVDPLKYSYHDVY